MERSRRKTVKQLGAGIFALGLALCMAGCQSTAGAYMDASALSVQVPVTQQQSAIDIPVEFFDEVLSSRYQYHGIGIINDQRTFQKLWSYYAKEATRLPPSIDFDNYALLFVYDPEYYNRVAIIGINILQGVANPIIEKTQWTLSIGGDPVARKVREQAGKPVPSAKVNVAFQQIPRHKPGRPGVTAVLVDGLSGTTPEECRVIPVPSHP